MMILKSSHESRSSVSRLPSNSDSRLKSESNVSLPMFEHNNSSSTSISSFGSIDGTSPRNVRGRRRGRSSSSDDVLPLFNASNNNCDGSGNEKSQEQTRSSSKERRISRTYSGSSVISSVVEQTKARLYIQATFGGADIVQIAMVFIMVMLVLHSQSGADFTVETLQRLRQEESLSLLQLQKIERQSLSLHENIRRRLQMGGVLEENEKDPLEQQHRQLEKMTSEIDSQAVTLQKRIQLAARKEIIKTYGEGPIKVLIELDFGSDHTEDVSSSNQISIALLPETPHSVWTLLDQVGSGLWNGAGLEWDTMSNMLQFHPTKTQASPRNRRLEFVESHPSDPRTNPAFHHGPWTVGLRESILDDDIDSADTAKDATSSVNILELFVNLADNREALKHETCIGMIVDGFYTLQRLLEASRMQEGKVITNITVKSITAMHITNHELKQLI
jgi:hypothetical protein